MTKKIENKLLKKISELQKEVDAIKGLDRDGIPTYQYSKMRDVDLNKLVTIEKVIDKNKFKKWFDNDFKLDELIEQFLKNLIYNNEDLIDDYNEEDLKIYFIVPILNSIDFVMREQNIRGFYENRLTYKTDDFIFNGTTDFVVSKGLMKSQKPYFFIQEFKRAEDYSNPRPQLLAELISAVELNNWKSIKGAYVAGESWHFVILEKLGDNSYQYFVSRAYNSVNYEDLTIIYKNLMFVKKEILALEE